MESKQVQDIASMISNPGDMFSNCETNFDYDFK